MYAIGYRPSETIEIDGRVGDLVREIRVPLVADPQQSAFVTVVCTDETGGPASRYDLTVMHGRSWSSIGVRDTGGRRELPLLPGKVVLVVGSTPSGGRPEIPWLPQRIEFDLVAGERVTRRLRLRPGGFIRVRSRGGSVRRPDRVLRGDRSEACSFLLDGDDEGIMYTAGPIEPGAYVVETDLAQGRIERVEARVRVREITLVRMGPRE